MTRKELKSFLKLGCDAIKIFFDAGLVSDFGKVADKDFPYVWLDLSSVDSEIPDDRFLLLDDWPIELHIAKKDSLDSIPNQYEQIVDECDDIARKLLWQYNLTLAGSDSIDTSATNQELYQRIKISTPKRQRFVKKHADILTGVILSFTLTSPDMKDVC